MFLGQFAHNIDEKGRLTVPARFRELLTAEGAFVMQGFDKNLLVLTTSAFEAISQRINTLSITDPTARLMRRLIFSTANRVEFDKAGRFLLPLFLRQAAGLENDVMIIGAGEYFEIWSVEQWAAQELLLHDAQNNAQRFSALDLTFRLASNN